MNRYTNVIVIPCYSEEVGACHGQGTATETTGTMYRSLAFVFKNSPLLVTRKGQLHLLSPL